MKKQNQSPLNWLSAFVLILLAQLSFGQVIFSEPFDEANGALSGTDNTGGVGWAITCPGCTGSWDINTNEWVINNTDAPAFWETTAPIDISSCTYIEITVQIEADGDFEDCGAGCNASDWIAMETNIDGGGWTPPANSYLCNNGCPNTDIIFSTPTETGEIITYSTNCMAGGNDLELRIYGQNWAGAEYWRIDDIQVSCSTGPSVDAGLPQLTCSGNDVTLTATNPDMGVISWDNGVTDGVSFTPPTGTTTYTATVTLGACSATDQVDVTVTPGPNFSIAATDATSCTAPFDGAITISNLSPGQSYDVTYSDGGTVGPTTVIADGSGNITISNLAPGSYTDFLVDSLGCTTLDATVLNIGTPGAPTIDAGTDQTICEGQQVTLTAFNPDMATISWDNSVNDGVAFTPPVGTTTYTVTGDLGGCIATDVVDVTVNAIPTIVVDPAGPYSPGSGVQTMTASPAGGTWSADCGACINASTGQFDPAVAGEGTWNICYDAGTPPCDDQECIQVVVTASCLLTGTITSSNPTCFGLNDGSATINVSNETGTVTFVITDSSGDVVNTGNSNTANNLSEGWYYFNVTDQLPCTFIDSVFLDDPNQIQIDLTVNEPPCFGIPNGSAIVDTVYEYTGAYNQISYFWSPNPSGSNGLGEDTLSGIGEGAYNLIINDENGCTESFDFNVTYPAELYFQELGADEAYCRLFEFQSGNGVVFAAAAGGTPDYDYVWLNLSDSSSTTNTTWGGLNPATYEITVTDNNGCILQETVQLDSLSPLADFTPTSPQFLTPGVCEGTAVVDVNFVNNSLYFANPNNPNADTTFFWNFNFDASNPSTGWLISDDVNETFDTSYTQGGIYEVCLVALNKNGCTDTACKEIIVYDPLGFTPPNVFTPNDDGANDVFTFNNLAQAIVEFECVILNRWGVKVAEFSAITDEWNGQNFNGSDCPEGVYFYTYRAVAQDGTEIEGQGNIHLLGK